MKRSAALILLMFALLFRMPAGYAAPSAGPIYARLVVPYFCSSEIPKDMDLIEEELNRITREKIGAEVNLVPLLALADNQPDARRQAELNLLEKEGISFDLFCDELPGYIESAIELNDLLEKYGQEILAVLDSSLPWRLEGDAPIYALPSVSDCVSSEGISMRRDLVEKYNIDLSQIHSPEDLSPIFQIIHENEPDMIAVCGYYTHSAILEFEINAQRIRGSVFSLGPDGKLVNYFASDDFRTQLELVRAWYLDGFVDFGMSTQNMEACALVRAGELFSFVTPFRPGFAQEASVNCGMEMVTIPLMDPVISNWSSTNRYWGITKTCRNPGKAMQFLNLLYSDSEVVNLLTYGIENVHYVLREDGTIGYPKGESSRTVGYVNSMPWQLPNQLIARVWEDCDVDLRNQLDTYNRSAPVSELAGFVFDDSSVAMQNDALNKVVSTYYFGLTSGMLDPALYLPQMLDQMESAGLKTVLKEAQRQYDQWLSLKED